jgi:aquaporin Z
MAFIYAMGDVSGAHFNPAVTFAFALRGAFPWSRLPGYCLAQLAGALAAAGLLRILFGDVAHLGATTPKHGEFQSLVMEILLTWLLVTVILGTATRYQLIGPSAALAVGATIALCGLFAGPVSGASMNPARSLGPAIVSGEMASAWISVAGPSVGASAAVLVAWILKGNKRPQEDKAAEG